MIVAVFVSVEQPAIEAVKLQLFVEDVYTLFAVTPLLDTVQYTFVPFVAVEIVVPEEFVGVILDPERLAVPVLVVVPLTTVPPLAYTYFGVHVMPTVV